MNVSLPKEQLESLETQIAAGYFASIDEALAIAVVDLKALSEDDLAWAKPYVKRRAPRSHAAMFLSGEEFFRRLNAKSTILRST